MSNEHTENTFYVGIDPGRNGATVLQLSNGEVRTFPFSKMVGSIAIGAAASELASLCISDMLRNSYFRPHLVVGVEKLTGFQQGRYRLTAKQAIAMVEGAHMMLGALSALHATELIVASYTVYEITPAAWQALVVKCGYPKEKDGDVAKWTVNAARVRYPGTKVTRANCAALLIADAAREIHTRSANT